MPLYMRGKAGIISASLATTIINGNTTNAASLPNAPFLSQYDGGALLTQRQLPSTIPRRTRPITAALPETPADRPTYI